jgi:uncharacterized protein (TIGR00730 family)
MRLETVAVFCGSALGDDSVYGDQAVRLGESLAHRGVSILYGGGGGLMGEVARAASATGGKVTAVVIRGDRGLAAELDLFNVRTVDTVHERKQLMSDSADAFVALPGGSGTAEELLEQWTWAQMRIHAKPSGVLNVAGFYDPLIALLENMVNHGFTKTSNTHSIYFNDDVDRLLDDLTQHSL